MSFLHEAGGSKEVKGNIIKRGNQIFKNNSRHGYLSVANKNQSRL